MKKNNEKVQENENAPKCFILNKIFEGAWNDKEGNISHEIINFFKTDCGGLFAYNEPYGSLPNDIYCFEDEKKSKYLAEYLLLTSRTKNKKFYIEYRIKLKKRLHRLKYVRDKNSEVWQKNKEEISNIIERGNIRYAGIYLDEIFSDNFDCLLVTFEAESIEKPKEPIFIDDLTYNFQRNKGYIRCDKYIDADGKSDYSKIEEKLNKATWEDYEPLQIGKSDMENLTNNKKTFLDLILKVNSEECYTNILYSILSYKDFLKMFLEKFTPDNSNISNNEFKIKRETGIVNGRMDICAESDDQRIVIENKVHSGLNGFEIIEFDKSENKSEIIENEDNSETQLSKYYDWARKKKNPICFIVCPDYHSDEIKKEIEVKDKNMKDKYKLIEYSKIEKFIEENLNEIEKDYEFYAYKQDFREIFKRHSQKDKKDKITNDFKIVINKKNNILQKSSE